MGQIITITSGKGGTGKTTTAAALSSCLAVLGKRTLCIDFDAELRNLDLALAMSNYAVMDFVDIASGRHKIKESCSESPQIPNLFFLTAPAAKIPDNIGVEEISMMFKNIRAEFDYCIIDAPAGVGRGFKLANADVDMSIIVTTGDLSAMRNATRTADVLRAMGVKKLRLIVNKVDRKKFRKIRTTIDDIIDITGVRLIAVVVEDMNIQMALHSGTPLVLYRNRKAAYEFLDAARRLIGEDLPLKKL
jgi:septum site-determining protein MinD